VKARLNTWDTDLERSVELDVTEPGGAVGATIVFPTVGEVSGRVFEADGRPAGGAEVCLTRSGESVETARMAVWSSSGWNPAALHLRVRAGADGAFRFVGTVPERRYDVRWWAGEEEERIGATDVASGTTGLEIRMGRHGLIVRPVDARDGRTILADTALVTGTPILLFGRDRGSEDVGHLAPAGARLRLHVRARGYADAFLDHVVSDAAGLEVVDVPMAVAGRLVRVRVRPVDAAGSRLPWPRSRFVHEASGATIEPIGVAGEDGFSTTDLGEGAYLLSTDDGGGFASSGDVPGLPGGGPLRFVSGGAVRFEVPFESASGSVDVSWTLESGGALRLATRDAGGTLVEPGDMRSIRATDTRGRETQVRLFRPSASGEWREGTGAAAVYESQALPAGEYVVAWYDRGVGGTRLASARVDVRRGEVADVDLRGP
jgi:hypothetical protein